MAAKRFFSQALFPSQRNESNALISALFKRSIVRSSSSACTSRTRSFGAIENQTNIEEDPFVSTYKKSKKLEASYVRILELVRKGGGQKGIDRQLKQGKLLARDRIKQLIDTPDDFVELSSIAGVGMPYGDIPAAGIISGIGKVHGHNVMIIANDGSVKGGTVFPITLKKQLRTQQIAQELSMPCVYIVDSGGAFLPLQAEIFIEGGRFFYNEAVMSSKGISQIAVVCGLCTAGGAYVPTMADETIMVHRIGSIFLGGPPLVKAALGEVVSAEELGGATMHSTVSGGVDHFAQNEAESYKKCRDVILSLNLPPASLPPSYDEPLHDVNDLDGLVTADNPNAHQLISRIVDGSGFQEFKPLYGDEIVTGFAFIAGLPVGIIANAKQSQSANASVKASHFVQLCSQRRIPIVFLTNHMGGTKSDPEISGEEMKCHARFMAAVSCADVPKVTIITGGYHGVNSYPMGGKALGSNFVFNWPSSSFGMESMDQMVDAVSTSEMEGKDDAIDKLKKTSSAVYAAANLWTDGIVLPHQTRELLKEVVRIFKYSEALKVAADAASQSRQVNFRM